MSDNGTKSDLQTVEADPERLRTLFENVLSNAAEHTGDGTVVRVGPLPDRDGFFVEDDGPGVPADERNQVFEHGFTTAPEGRGSDWLSCGHTAGRST